MQSATDGPLVVLLGEECADETDDHPSSAAQAALRASDSAQNGFVGDGWNETLWARRKDGGFCRSRAVGTDGFCSVHGPNATLNPVTLGRKAGVKSGKVRREQSLSARERLRQLADEDAEIWARLTAAYRDGLNATNADGSPDYRTRVQAAGAFLSEAYGRPAQAIVGDAKQPLAIVIQELEFGAMAGDRA